MTLGFQSLLMAVLVVCGAVVILPIQRLILEPRVTPPLRSGLREPGLWLVETPSGQWFVNGSSHSNRGLVLLLRNTTANQVIHYLPSDALTLKRVSTSLRWLRSQAPKRVVLELPTQHFRPEP